MSTKLEQAARQALEALERSHHYIDEYHPEWIQVRFENEGAITALREALDHSAAAGNKVSDHIAASGKVIAEPVEQEPVAIVDANDKGYWADILPDRDVKVGQLLYAAPVDAKAIRAEALEEAAKVCRTAQAQGLQSIREAIEAAIRGMK